MRLDTWNISGSGFHFGQHGMDQEETSAYFPSDSLFAALLDALATFKGSPAVDSWIDNYCKDPPAFVLTSAFPRAGIVRFFPAPLRRTPGGNLKPKDLKRIQFVSEVVFRNIIQGKGIEPFVQEQNFIQGKTILVSNEERDQLPASILSNGGKIWQIEQRPRVTVGRIQQNSTLYHTGRVAFAEQCGLWFGIRWVEDSDELKSQFKNLLQIVGDSGLGGERSSGFGKAIIKQDKEIDLPDSGGSPWITLSRYAPRSDETSALLDARSAYVIQRVGGWLHSPNHPTQRRRLLHMCKEGSVFGPLQRLVPGRLVDVRPIYEKLTFPHPVYRCGMAVTVGIQFPEEHGG